MNVSNGPPKDASPSDLWTKLTTLPRPNTEIAYPRKNHETGEMFTEKVAIWVLTEHELMIGRAAADKFAKSALDNGEQTLGYQEIYRNECVVQVICLACRRPENLRMPAFPSPEMARKYITSDEFAVLFQAYCDFQVDSGPMLSSMTAQEMNAWIAVLQEGGSRSPLARLSLEKRTELLMHSVSLLPKSPTDSGSSGSPPSVSWPPTDQEKSETSASDSV